MIIKEKLQEKIELIKDFTVLTGKKIRNRIPDWVIDFSVKYILPYLSIIVVSGFVFIGTFVQAQDNNVYIPNEQVMDLSPGETAKIVSVVGSHATPGFEEDSIQLALSLQDQNFINKPIIAETQKTNNPVQETGDRKNNITYEVQTGDTISSIGWRYGLKIATIKALNDLNSDNIKIGQKLKLPPQDLSQVQLAKLTPAKSSGTQFNSAGGKGMFKRPTSGWDLSQRFGSTSFNNNHTGIDLTSRSGTVIYASASGRIASTNRGWGGGYGNHIIIDHGSGFKTLYGHMTSFSVSAGQYVEQGQKIGIMGSTGWSTGTHLHFEIRKNNVPQNPLNYL